MANLNQEQDTANIELSLLAGSVNSQSVLVDEMGRAPFAKGIAQLIIKSPKNECLVVGIEGAWGEGKSYAIELIKREIEKHNQSIDKPNLNSDKPIKWMVFNPWQFKGSDHLVSLFLKSLAVFIEQEAGQKPPKWRMWLKCLLAPVKWVCDFFIRNKFFLRGACLCVALVINIVANSIAPNNVLYYGIWLLLWLAFEWLISPQAMTDSKKALVSISRLLRDYAEIQEDYEDSLSVKTPEQLKKEVTQKLCDNNLPFSHIIVAVEDLDRLNPEEIRTMVQLMRMIADFPKIIYLVGYDRQHVINALGDMAGHHASADYIYNYGEGYLQKVVQAAYRLPHPAEGTIGSLVFDKFNMNFVRIYGTDFNKSPHWKETWPSLAKLITSMRVGERIVNRAMQLVLMLQNKSDPADVLVASYLMEYQRDLWDFLWQYRGAVLNGGRMSGPGDNLTPQERALRNQEDIQNRIRGNAEVKGLVFSLLQTVFPSLRDGKRHEYQPDEKQSFPMGAQEFMESYFSYEKSRATETPEIIHDLLVAVNDDDRNKVLQRILTFDDSMIEYILKELQDKNESAPMDWQTQALPLLCFLGIKFDDTKKAMLIYWLAVSFINSQPESMRVHAFNDLLSHWLNDGAQFLPMNLFEVGAMESGFVEPVRIMASHRNRLNLKLSEDEFNSFKARLENKINLWIQSDRNRNWLKHVNVAAMLFMWLRLSDEQARKVIDGWVADDRHVLELLNAMMKTTYTFDVIRSKEVMEKRELNKDELEKLTGLNREGIQARVNQAASNVPGIAKGYPEVIKAVRELSDISFD